MLLIAFALAALLAAAQAVTISTTKAQYIFAGTSASSTPIVFKGRDTKTTSNFGGAALGSLPGFAWPTSTTPPVNVISLDVCSNPLAGILEVGSAIVFVNQGDNSVYYTDISFNHAQQTVTASRTLKIFSTTSQSYISAAPRGVACVDGNVFIADNYYGLLYATQLAVSSGTAGNPDAFVPLLPATGVNPFNSTALPNDVFYTRSGTTINLITSNVNSGLYFATVQLATNPLRGTLSLRTSPGPQLVTGNTLGRFALNTGSNKFWGASGSTNIASGTYNTASGAAVATPTTTISTATDLISDVSFSDGRLYYIANSNSVRSIAEGDTAVTSANAEATGSSLTSFDVFYTASAASFAPQAFALAFFSALAAFFRRAL